MTKDGTTDIAVANLIKAYGVDDVQLQFRVQIAWTDATYGDFSMDFRFNDDIAQECMNLCADNAQYNKGMGMAVNGAVGLENLTFTTQIVALNSAGDVIQTINGETVPASAATVS